MVNGLYLTLKKLEKCVAYVQKQADFGLDMSVRQTLLFTSLLQEPDNNKGFDTKSRVSCFYHTFNEISVCKFKSQMVDYVLWVN